ncbi:MAG: DUF2267 domain-containing protein [Dehalococcoidia bacterium]
MQSTGVSTLDTSVQKTNIWLKEVMEEIGSDDRRRAYLALRSTLQTLRDRLTVEEATDLGAQLPMLVRGFYYEGWNPSGKPVKFGKDDFLSSVGEHFVGEPGIDGEKIAQAVFKVLDRHITDGEIEDVKAILPRDLQEFWESLRS